MVQKIYFWLIALPTYQKIDAIDRRKQNLVFVAILLNIYFLECSTHNLIFLLKFSFRFSKIKTRPK